MNAGLNILEVISREKNRHYHTTQYHEMKALKKNYIYTYV